MKVFLRLLAISWVILWPVRIVAAWIGTLILIVFGADISKLTTHAKEWTEIL